MDKDKPKNKNIRPKKRAPGGGAKKGQTNNPKGRPVGAIGKASKSVKDAIASFYIGEIGEDQKTELERILNELSLNNTNNSKELSKEYKITTSLKYLRFIASFARDEGEVETENKIKNLFMEKFLGIKQE
jgi:hypothetical protein